MPTPFNSKYSSTEIENFFDLLNSNSFITNTVSNLVNYYLKSDTYSKSEVDSIINTVKNGRFQKVNSLPEEDIDTNVIYLVQKQDTENNNIKDEYINLDGTSTGWEKIGSTEINLDGYVTIQALNAALSNYVQSSNIVTILANRTSFSSVADMVATPAADLYDGCLAYVTGTKKNYQYDGSNDTDQTLGKWRELQTSGGGTGGGHTIEDSEGTDLTQRDTLQFGEGLLAEDDSTNEKTVVALDPMPSEDIDEVVDIYPQAGELVSIVNAFNRGDIYSTDEKMIGQWVDGKPLYQLVVSYSFTGVTARTYTNILDLTSYNIDTFVNAKGYIINSNSDVKTKSFPLADQNNRINAVYDRTTKYLQLLTYEVNGWILSGHVIVQYTKTTDVAISIGNTTEYSTDEKVVGTWIDGKPVYQKTFVLNNPRYDWQPIDIGLGNVDALWKAECYAETSDGTILIEHSYGTTSYFTVMPYVDSSTHNASIYIQTKPTYPAKVNITLQYTKTSN